MNSPTDSRALPEQAQEALPCPFCGAVGLAFSEGSTFRWRVAECSGCGATTGEERIQTLGDGSREEWEANCRERLIAAWNRRASPAAPDAMREALETARDSLREVVYDAGYHLKQQREWVFDSACTALSVATAALAAPPAAGGELLQGWHPLSESPPKPGRYIVAHKGSTGGDAYFDDPKKPGWSQMPDWHPTHWTFSPRHTLSAAPVPQGAAQAQDTKGE